MVYADWCRERNSTSILDPRTFVPLIAREGSGTLGARGLSCLVSGAGHVSIVTRARKL